MHTLIFENTKAQKKIDFILIFYSPHILLFILVPFSLLRFHLTQTAPPTSFLTPTLTSSPNTFALTFPAPTVPAVLLLLLGNPTRPHPSLAPFPPCPRRRTCGDEEDAGAEDDVVA